jgi:hypothetical protein
MGPFLAIAPLDIKNGLDATTLNLFEFKFQLGSFDVAEGFEVPGSN